MHIERVQIEEGFLDGLDVSFVRGLNVIIGERGTGKTSLIELIRFCLGVEGYTSESSKRSLDHALSVLGSGEVTVTLGDAEHAIHVTRTASDSAPRATGRYRRPIIFSQTEIENVGLRAQGRLRLLDSFGVDQKETQTRESEAVSQVRSYTAEVEALRREIDELARQVKEISALDQQIAELVPKEQELAKVSADANEKKSRLDAISANIAASAVGVGAIERFHQSISRWQSSLSSLSSSAPVLEPWPEGAGPDPLAHCRASVERAKDYLSKALEELEKAAVEAEKQFQSSSEDRLKFENNARQLRKEIESLQAGAGATVRQGQQLRERKAQLESLKTVQAERQELLRSLLSRRNAAMDRLDSSREDRFSVRDAVAKGLTKTLGPHIRVKVTRAGQFEAFAAAISDVLRGSGLRYNELSSTLAGNISPRELLEAVDRNDFDFLAETTGITKDRAARALAQLRETDLGALATVPVEDTVTLQLLDGSDYKSIGELSTGQRCTVVLPLVLRHSDRILVVDQPEDHIDNAFITDTLIVSVLARSVESQIIFSTHNANIPVLGNADRVIQLGSDGKRGFAILASTLDDPSVVEAITTVMEGGAEAFNRRAKFYSQHENP